MKNFYFLVIAMLLTSNFLFAQDVVVKRNGEEMKTQIVEIGDTHIKYRKFENPQGPIYTIPAAEVFVIRFADGTKEVVTPLDTPTATTPATDSAYAPINQIVQKTKAPFRDKLFFVGPRVEVGYAAISSKSGNLSGPVYSVGVIAEYMFDKATPNGLGMGLSYDMYTLETDYKLHYMNIDWYYVFRPRSHWNLFMGIKLGIPTKSEILGVDFMEGTKTTFGIEMGAGWATKHFDLGMAFFSNFSNTLESAENNRLLGIKLRVAYRF